MHQARIARALHIGAAAFALGALASLYARGLAFEYRAGWDSTFLDADGVQRLLAVVLWPATALAGFPLPDAPTLAALRFSTGPGENAARWIHAHAIGVVAVVVLPRLLLAASRAGARGASRAEFRCRSTTRTSMHWRSASPACEHGEPGTGSIPADPPRSVALSLVSHTNVGKTTLARTLLRATSARCATRRTSPRRPSRSMLIESPPATAWSCGTRRASATACAWPGGWRRPATRSAGS